MTSLTAALDGVATIARPDGGVRRLAVADLVTGDGANALTPGELLTRVDLPAAALTARAAFRQVSLSAVGRSAVLVIARRPPASTAPGETVVTVTAATPRPLQLRFAGHPAPGDALGRARCTPNRGTWTTCTAARRGGPR